LNSLDSCFHGNDVKGSIGLFKISSIIDNSILFGPALAGLKFAYWLLFDYWCLPCTILLSFAKVTEHYPFYYIPLTLPSPPTTGERIKVRGSNVMAIFVPLFT
jgi:hypothetical protein